MEITNGFLIFLENNHFNDRKVCNLTFAINGLNYDPFVKSNS